ncbi:MAG: aspartate ammonia-lyase [Salinivirgaceae bacterium]|nr:aspartate ammonia-lyase [Salinivirgaceae bacterium]
MDQLKISEFIKDVTLFGTLNEDQIILLSSNLEEIHFKKGGFIFKENSERDAVYAIYEGEVELFKSTPFGEEKRLSFFQKYDFMGEGSLMDNSPHSTTARALTDVTVLALSKDKLNELFESETDLAAKVYKYLAKLVARRMNQANMHLINVGSQYVSGRTRTEHDLLGDREVPAEAYYGVQTLRAMENFNISGTNISFYPVFPQALAMVKMAAAKANNELGLINDEITNAIVEASDEIIKGKWHKNFAVDMIQGGAGTSTNMAANEVIANRALEILGHRKGEYKYCHPNNHVNLSQSTNDAYPTAVKIALILNNRRFIDVLKELIFSFHEKARDFRDVIKMGRTQLQDAVPMTLGQEFEAYAVTLEEEIERIEENVRLFLEVNMGATAIGTGINSEPEYSEKCIKHLRDITGLDIKLAGNLVEATQDTGAFVMYSSAIKRTAIKLSKICNDLRLLSSGPRTGLNEINLPPMQPGSSIMPGKVNPVIPEVVNQIAFKVIGNDITVTLGSEAGQLQLNVMEPVIVQSIFESVEMLKNGMEVLRYRCIDGITANVDHCRELVHHSIGIVTALNPILGYEICNNLAKEALKTGRSVYDLVVEQNLMTEEALIEALAPENMISPKKMH